MQKWFKVLIIILILLVLGGAGYFVWTKYYVKEKKETTVETKQILRLDSQKETTHLSKVANTKGVYWVRAFDMFWNDIEPQKGQFNWSIQDERMKEFTEQEIYPLVIVKPFANWDQNTCHPDSLYEAEAHGPMIGEKIKVGKPCDMTAYAQFLEKAVERYDGDGKDDMPGLEIPIKYWEIMNEPSMQGGVTGGVGEELKFFKGTSDEYLEILKTSYQTIKKADSRALVLHAGMAGMQQNFQSFWEPIFDQGGGNYFDIANIHTINTDENRHDLYIIKFKKFLDQYGIGDKPIWITEVQYGELTKKPEDLKSFEVLMAKSTILALAQGADKLFYIDNWLSWDQIRAVEKPEEKEKEEKLKINSEKFESSTHKVYLNLVNKINNFDKIEKIKEEIIANPEDFDGSTSNIGQYRFISGKKEIYVLWGAAEVPDEISGKIKVTDIYGKSRKINANALKLSDEPIFVEIL